MQTVSAQPEPEPVVQLTVTRDKAGFECEMQAGRLVVIKITKGGAADQLGVQLGMVLKTFQGKPCTTWAQVVGAVRSTAHPWHFELAVESEPPSEQELVQKQESTADKQEQIPMEQWSAAQVSDWVLQIELPPSCVQAVYVALADWEGDELVDLKAKTLHRMLAKDGLSDPSGAVEAFLGERNAALGAQKASGHRAAGGAGGNAPTDCPLCFEPYRDEGPRVPRILLCGHGACQGCYAHLLRLAPVDEHGHGKRFACPTCREVTNVRGGSAANLPKVFSLLR